ncbi:hypothetical protein [uncultured Desulfobacter sp.]|nr:hypothetical protein [uncultured Desulfobacter sp.]
MLKNAGFQDIRGRIAPLGLDHNVGHFVLIFSEPEKYRWNYKLLTMS